MDVSRRFSIHKCFLETKASIIRRGRKDNFKIRFLLLVENKNPNLQKGKKKSNKNVKLYPEACTAPDFTLVSGTYQYLGAFPQVSSLLTSHYVYLQAYGAKCKGESRSDLSLITLDD